jgi:hypothetical protein
MHVLVRNSVVKTILPQLIAAFIVTSSAASQDAPNPPAPSPYDQAFAQAVAAQAIYSAGSATIGFAPAILTIPAQAFTAQRVYTQWDPGGDPTNPSVTTTVTIARDAQGRIHSENSLTPGMVEVIVSDPVGQLSYRYIAGQPASIQLVAANCAQQLNSNVTPAPTPAPAATPPPIPASPAPGKQDLGTQTMQGTLAYGQQQTSYLTIDNGTVTIQTVDWFSPTLGLNLQETSQTSGQASHTIQIQQLQPGNPDPTLFTLPSGFTLPDPSANCGTQSTPSPVNNTK